jgi:hypothetical protein
MQASAAGDGDADLIQEASDKALATFSSKRKLLIDLCKERILRARMESKMRGHHLA